MRNALVKEERELIWLKDVDLKENMDLSEKQRDKLYQTIAYKKKKIEFIKKLIKAVENLKEKEKAN